MQHLVWTKAHFPKSYKMSVLVSTQNFKDFYGLIASSDSDRTFFAFNFGLLMFFVRSENSDEKNASTVIISSDVATSNRRPIFRRPTVCP
jgi:hypothetical protein